LERDPSRALEQFARHLGDDPLESFTLVKSSTPSLSRHLFEFASANEEPF
jgi:hypothetical protein